MSENRHPTVVISKVIELFNPLWHLVASEEIVNSQTEPAAHKYKHDKQHLLEKVAFEVIDLQCSLDRQYNTDNPTNKCNHSIKVLVNVDAKIQIFWQINVVFLTYFVYLCSAWVFFVHHTQQTKTMRTSNYAINRACSVPYVTLRGGYFSF